VKSLPVRIESAKREGSQRGKTEEVKIERKANVDFIQNLASQEDDKHHELLLAIILCHNIETKFDSESNKFIYRYKNQFTEEMIRFANSFNYFFKASYVSSFTLVLNYIVQIQDATLKYPII